MPDTLLWIMRTDNCGISSLFIVCFHFMQAQDTDCKPVKKKGMSRLLAACFYSLDGLRSAFTTEAAFRQELCLVAFTTVVLFFLPLSGEWKGLLFLATTAVLVVELLNSAIESVVDLASSDYHLLAKRAKDIGSAAVFVSISLAILLWGGAVLSIFLENAK